MLKSTFWFIALVLMVVAGPFGDIQASTYYVDCNNLNADDDNPGTAELPFEHILKANSLVVSGDSVVVMPGTYREFIAPYFGDTASDWVTFLSAVPHEAVLDGKVPLDAVCPESEWELADPESPDNIWFRVMKSSFTGFPALYSEAWMDGNRIPVVFDYPCGSGDVFEEGMCDVRRDSLFVWLEKGDDPIVHSWEVDFRFGCNMSRKYMRVEGFVFTNFGDSGIYISKDKTEALGNLCIGNGRSGISVISTGVDTVLVDGNEASFNCGGIGYSQGITVYKATGPFNIIRNNISHDNFDGGPCGTDGKGFSYDTSSSNGGAIFENNIAYGNMGPGFAINLSWNATLVNNVSFNNLQGEEWGGAEYIIRSTVDKNSNNIIMRNNIAGVRAASSKRGLQILYHKDMIPEELSIELDHNLFYKWPYTDENTKMILVNLTLNGTTHKVFDMNLEEYQNFSVRNYTPGWGVGAVFSDPLIPGWSNGDFRLSEDSPAIDAGTEENAPALDFFGTPRPQGSAVDIGAHEYIQ